MIANKKKASQEQPDQAAVAVCISSITIGGNPSKRGGAWAWCQVNRYFERTDFDSGVVVPTDLGVSVVTNNMAEIWAAVCALKRLPDRWSGDVVLTGSSMNGEWMDGHFNGVPSALRYELGLLYLRLGYGFTEKWALPSKAKLASLPRGTRKALEEHTRKMLEQKSFLDKLCAKAAKERGKAAGRHNIVPMCQRYSLEASRD